ncbi:MAG: hypothetical protein QM773_17480 [Hyphomonadaceae bacterium]
MNWLDDALINRAYGFIALGVAGAALAPALLLELLSGWFSWRSSRLSRLAKRFRGRGQLAEEQISSLSAEEKDLQRMMGEMEAAGKG